MQGSIRRRSKTSWEITLDLGRDAEGKRLRKYVNVKGKKADAEKALRDLLTAVDRGLPISTEKITVGQWLETWVNDYATINTRQRTQERYKGIIRKHLLPHIGHLLLEKLKPGEIRVLETNLILGGMAPAGVELVHRVLFGALKYAVKMEVLHRNAAQAVTPPRIHRREVRPPSVATVSKLLELAQSEDHPLYPAMRLIAYTAIRRGECLGLRWDSVDFDAGTITIVLSLVRSTELGVILEPPKRDSSRRVIDLDQATVDVLRQHRVRQMEHRLLIGQAYVDDGLVFADDLGQRKNPMSLTRAVQTLGKRIGENNLKPHDLRHFHASVLLQSGQSPVIVSKRLGHSSVSMTLDIYSHLLPGWQKEAADAFAKAMEQR